MKKRTKLILIIGSASAVLIILLLLLLNETNKSTDVKLLENNHAGHGQQKQSKTDKSVKSSASEKKPVLIEIPVEKQQMIGVKTVPAEFKDFQKKIKTIGRVELDEKKQSTINAKFEGWIEKLYVDYTGKYVRKGDPLVEIYSPDLLASQEEYLNLLKWGKGENKTKENDALIAGSYKKLKLLDISDEQIKKIEETGKSVRTLILYSPTSGYVMQKMAVSGMKVMPGEKLFDIADLSIVWISADIYESDLPFIREGQAAVLELSHYPGKKFYSKIEYIYPMLSGETRTAKIRIPLPNKNAEIKPLMYTNVEININMGKKLIIPVDAVIDTGSLQIVYIDKGNGYFEQRLVTVGFKGDDSVEIIAGLKAGEKVVFAANFLIDSEAQLKGINPAHNH